MLFRKTFRNALATLLGMALALATGAAHAQINLDALGTAADPVGTVVFSAETLPGNVTTTVGGVTYYRILPSSADFRVSGKIGVPGAAGRQVYIRYDFGNMVVHEGLSLDSAWANIPDTDPVTTGNQALPGSGMSLEVGGGSRQNYVIYSAPEDAVISRDAVAVATAHNRLALRQGAAGTIRMTVYFDLSSAINQTSPLTDKSATVAVLAPSLRTVVTPGILTATVRSGFTALAETGYNTIGTLAIAVGGGSTVMHKSARDGSVVNTLAQVAQVANAQLTSGSVVTFSGNFSVGIFGTNTAATAACTTSPSRLTTMRNDQLLESVSIAAAINTTSLCLAIPPTNREEIPSGEYTVAVDYAPVTNAAVAPSDLGETPIGVIRRDGTRVQIPYLTTFENYNQRVVLVNRNRNPVSYTFSFVSEDGATTTAGEAAEGSVPGNSTVVLRAKDIVSIANSTRTAATLDVVATDGTVDVATTQVNLDDQGTDTVIYATTGT